MGTVVSWVLTHSDACCFSLWAWPCFNYLLWGRNSKRSGVWLSTQWLSPELPSRKGRLPPTDLTGGPGETRPCLVLASNIPQHRPSRSWSSPLSLGPLILEASEVTSGAGGPHQGAQELSLTPHPAPCHFFAALSGDRGGSHRLGPPLLP